MTSLMIPLCHRMHGPYHQPRMHFTSTSGEHELITSTSGERFFKLALSGRNVSKHALYFLRLVFGVGNMIRPKRSGNPFGQIWQMQAKLVDCWNHVAAKLLAGVDAAVLPTVSDVQLSALAKGGALKTTTSYLFPKYSTTLLNQLHKYQAITKSSMIAFLHVHVYELIESWWLIAILSICNLQIRYQNLLGIVFFTFWVCYDLIGISYEIYFKGNWIIFFRFIVPFLYIIRWMSIVLFIVFVIVL